MADRPFEVIATAQQQPSLALVRRLDDVGVDHLAIIPTTYAEDASIDERCDAVERYAEEVIQAYRA
jgi:hypothetical protein